jgi:uncharacterized protein (TIGR00730 family)
MNEKRPAPPGTRIPEPPHPVRRRQPLPGHRPKSPAEDPGAPQRVQTILASPSYRLAEEDQDFIATDAARGLRLQIEYLKAEVHFEQQGVRDTIVVFGSTRIPEPAVALSNMEALRAALARDPADGDAVRGLAIAERILAKSRYYDVARAFGRLVGESSVQENEQEGAPPKFEIMTGGGPGIMEAANRGAFDAGAKSVGLNIHLPHEQYPNPYITPELCLQFRYFALRKLHFLLRAKALVAFPGGYGTFDELFEVLTLVQTRKIKPLPIVLVGEDYWRRAFDIGFLVDEGVIDPEDSELFWFAETASEIWDGIRYWHHLYDARNAER